MKAVAMYPGRGVHAVDWDGDGDLDLLVGNIEGQVFFIANEGTRERPAYGTAKALVAAGIPIGVPHGDAGPFAADWDGDGRLDLLVGCGAGSVFLYRNQGSTGEPALAVAEELVSESNASSRPGIRSKLCVIDFNGDGRLDLLVGDFSHRAVEPAAEGSEERQSRDALAEKHDSLTAAYAEVKKRPDHETDEHRKARVAKMRELLNEVRLVKKQLAPRRPTGQEMHGWVWLFERKPAETKAASR
ncbi:MAG TPA: VCBS repeat-containing protein [Pirellulales bacterium]|nr:VCBS repeat-containing protein [Pirellulales bacterium]